MYDNIKKLCNEKISICNRELKSCNELDKYYYIGIKQAYTNVLNKLYSNEKYIKQKGGGYKCNYYKSLKYL